MVNACEPEGLAYKRATFAASQLPFGLSKGDHRAFELAAGRRQAGATRHCGDQKTTFQSRFMLTTVMP